MSSTSIAWVIVSPLIAANLIWFYLTLTPWIEHRDHDSLVKMGIQIGITLLLGLIPVVTAYRADKRLDAKRKRQARSKRVSWQADQLENLSE